MARKQKGDGSSGNVPAIAEPGVPIPWEEKSRSGRLLDAVDVGLANARDILGLELDLTDRSPTNVKLMLGILNASLAIIAQQARLDEAKLKASRETGGGLAEFYRNYGAADEDEAS